MKKADFVPWYMQPDVVKGYETWYEGKYKRADNLEKQVISEMLEQFDNPRTILEIGSGTSHFTRWLSSVGYSSTGSDLSPHMIRQAKQLWPDGDLLNASASHLPFEKNSFDLSMFVTCFEYMPNPSGVLRESARVAKHGIVMGLMNSWSLPTARRKIQLLFGRNDYYRNAHFYSIREIQKLTRNIFGESAYVASWKTTLFPKPLGLERAMGNPFGAFLGVAIRKKNS